MLKSWQARRREQRSCLGTYERKELRVLSVHQNRRKAEPEDMGDEHVGNGRLHLVREFVRPINMN